MKPRVTLWPRIMLWLWAAVFVGTAVAQDDPAGAHLGLRGEFDVDTALTIVYGRPPWSDAQAKRTNTFGNGTDFIEPLFDEAYVEAGVEKHIVIATLTPRPRSQYGCHACSPMLGGAVFSRNGDEWRLESVGREIEESHAWFDSAHGRLRLVRIGPERFGLLHEIHDGGQGYEYRRASVILGVDGKLTRRFSVRYPETGESAGPGACGVPEQNVDISIADDGSSTGAEAALFDLVVDATWNKAACQEVHSENGPTIRSSGEACRQRLRYRFSGGEYRLFATELDVCAQLPERVSSLKG